MDIPSSSANSISLTPSSTSFQGCCHGLWTWFASGSVAINERISSSSVCTFSIAWCCLWDDTQDQTRSESFPSSAKYDPSLAMSSVPWRLPEIEDPFEPVSSRLMREKSSTPSSSSESGTFVDISLSPSPETSPSSGSFSITRIPPSTYLC